MTDTDILKSVYKGDELEDALKKYGSGIPAAYIIGEWEFFGIPFKVNENCLIPRCDTERVVEKAISLCKENAKIADLCTGSGCIAISILKNRPDVFATAVDISEKALDLAKENAERNGVSDRIEFLHCDVLSDVPKDRFFDLIVSNPPYISKKDMEVLDEYVKKEPALALFGGDDGMDFYKAIIEKYAPALLPDGKFVFEIGYDQGEKIRILAKKNDFSCKVLKDYSGNDRVAVIQ